MALDFYINIPIGMIILLFGLLYLHEHLEPEAGRFDWLGFLLAAPGMALAVLHSARGLRVDSALRMCLQQGPGNDAPRNPRFCRTEG